MFPDNIKREITEAKLRDVSEKMANLCYDSQDIASSAAGTVQQPITPTSTAPTITNGYWAVTIPGTYTNFGNVVLPENNFGFIFKNGGSFTIQSVEMPTILISNQVIENDTNAVEGGAVYTALEPLKRKFEKDEPFYFEPNENTLSSIPTNRTIIRNKALEKSYNFKYLRVYVSVSGVFRVGIFQKPSSSEIKAIRYTDEITLYAGNQVIELPSELICESGNYIGVFCKTGRIYVDTSKSSQLGGDRVYTTGIINIGDTVVTTGTSNYDLFSLFENYTIDEQITNATTSKSIGVGTILAKNTNTANLTTPNPLFIADTFGFNQPLHPTVEYFENGFNGYKYVMVQTPYPQSANTIYKDRFECPTIHYSNDKINWTAGKLVDDLTSEEITAKSYLSDPELVRNTDTNKLELWYRITHVAARTTEGSTIGTQLLRKIINSDGTFSTREVLMTEVQMQATTAQEIRSMAILYENGTYKMWFTGMAGGNVGFGYTTTPTISTSWVFEKVTMTNKKTNTWHLDVVKDGSNIWFIDCTVLFDLHLFKWISDTQFTFVKILLERTNNTKDYYSNVVYRSSGLIVNGVYSVFISAWNNKFASIGLMEGTSFENLKLIDGGYVRQDMRIGGNVRLNNTTYIKSLIELDDRGNALGWDYESKTLYLINDSGVKKAIITS